MEKQFFDLNDNPKKLLDAVMYINQNITVIKSSNSKNPTIWTRTMLEVDGSSIN